jgi:putative transposase
LTGNAKARAHHAARDRGSRNPEDRNFYLFHLRRLLARARCRLHAYCLMSNHVHLLLTAEQTDGCALLVKSVGQLHTQYINKRYGRNGHLWQGRFHSCLVQAEGYLLACYRYIELNPVRAGLARDPADYRWSSHAANARGEPDGLLSPHAEYLRLGATSVERQLAYRSLFGEAPQPRELEEIRTATNGGYALGNAAFKRSMALALGRRVDKGIAGRPPRTQPSANQLDLFGPQKTWSVPD